MKKIIKHGLMYVASIFITLSFLKLANDAGSIWINIAWAYGVLFGIETVLFMQIIEEWKKKESK